MAIPSLASYPLPTASAFPASKVSWPVHPSRAVLLIHDMQDYFLAFYGADSPLSRALLERVGRLRAWARQWGIPVVYTAQPTEQRPADRALLNDMWGPGLTAADPALQAVAAPIAPEAGDTVLVKWRYSAFQRSNLEALMKQQWGRDQLLICGIYAHIGCLTTALDAFMRDIQPFMVGDAVADFSAAEHQMALNYVAGRCGRVLGVDEITALQPLRPTREWLTEQILARLPDPLDALDPDENLMDYGLDSVQVMSLVAEWRRLGVQLRFEDLARLPTLNGWWAALAGAAQAQAPALAA
ncbi:MAG: isochorismatase family protein [Rhodocyclales bacterium]|nr:isochorismatase family protein [Rhodocyclales bacterium]